VKEAGDVQAVKDCIKKVPFSQWAERLRETFNNDGPIRIRVEKGIFKQGDNKLIDRDEFHVAGTQVTTLKDFPIDATFGRLIKAPEEYEDVKGLVVSDYQDELEKAWIDTLRKKYPVVINKDVLSTVNKH
jgi:peptidyl-prolyl cis-trans isomerase SurA